MKKYRTEIISIILLMIWIFSISGCGSGGGIASGTRSGSVILNLATRDGSRDFPKNTSYFVIQLYNASGQIGNDQRVYLPNYSAIFDDVPSGNVDVKVGAYNATDYQIGYGEASTIVHDGYNAPVEVLIKYQPSKWAGVLPLSCFIV